MKYTYPTIILCLTIALLLSISRCTFNRRNADSALASITDTITYFTNSLNTKTASITTLQLQESQLKKAILDKDKELTTLAKKFSNVKNIVHYSQEIKFDTIRITYKDIIPCLFERSGKVDSTWYSFAYKSNNKQFVIDSLTIPNRTIVITGFKRKWIFGKEILVTDVTNTNPYITVKTLQ